MIFRLLRVDGSRFFNKSDNSGSPFRNKRFFISESIFLTESERSGERLLKAARRVSGSESINGILDFLTGLAGRKMMDFECWIVDDGLMVRLRA